MPGFETYNTQKIDNSQTYSLPENTLKKIEREVMRSKYGFRWGFHDESYDRGIKHISETEYMIPGTLELIGRVVKAAKSAEPYDTIVFLDKAARPAAHLYRGIISEMRNQGLLDPKLKLPDIKFIDIGKTDPQWKLESAETPENIRNAIPPEIMLPKGEHSRVLIVDEFMDTGKTLRVAKTLFRNAYGVEAEGTYQFAPKHAPFWYKRVNLTQDAAVFEQPLKTLEDPNVRETMTYLANNLPKEAFVALLEKVDVELNPTREGTTPEELIQFMIERDGNGNQFPSYITKTNPEEMMTHLRALSEQKLVVYPESIYDIVKSHSGILTRPEEGSKERNLELREMLDTLAKAVVREMVEVKRKGL